jgi:hypothetical protein
VGHLIIKISEKLDGLTGNRGVWSKELFMDEEELREAVEGEALWSEMGQFVNQGFGQ